MIKTRILPSLSLLLFLLAACAPAAPATELPAQQPVAPVAVEPTATPIHGVVEEQPPVDSTLASALPPRVGRISKRQTRVQSALHREVCNSLSFSASLEQPAKQWRPWCMGSKQNTLAESNLLISMQMTVILHPSRKSSAFSTNLKFTYWMETEMF